MARLYERHTKRKVVSLDGMWKFRIDPERRGIREKWFENFPADSMDVVVPSCWNNELGLYDYEGCGWYYTTFRNTGNHVNLIFHAVTGQAEVYVDGRHLGGHYGGFTGFNFVLRDLVPGEHTLAVLVDNIHNDTDTIPLARVDWFHYGGITRSVELMELPEIWIRKHRVEYTLSEDLKTAALGFDIHLEAFSAKAAAGELRILLNDRIVARHTLKEGALAANVRLGGIPVRDVKLWDIGKPNLYTVTIEIDGDDSIERIGFRKIEAKNQKILLNGREIFIKGVNRHEDHPDWGFAIPLKLMKRDMDIIKDMGCNAIRGSHYPNSELFLDLCDQEGMLFWEEIPMWQYFDKHFRNPAVVGRGLGMLEEMVERDYHHPSIIIWSVHNEVDTNEPSCFDMTKLFVEKVKSLDSSRLLTYASYKDINDICFSLVDLVCLNKYLGWYHDQMEDWGKFIDTVSVKLENEGLSHLPMVISEFGAAGLYGDVTFEGPKWTENYQESYLNYTLNLFLNHPRLAGTYIWQYCDIRTAKEMEMGRARSFNNKGIVNEYRKPKMAYWTVKKLYKSID